MSEPLVHSYDDGLFTSGAQAGQTQPPLNLSAEGLPRVHRQTSDCTHSEAREALRLDEGEICPMVTRLHRSGRPIHRSNSMDMALRRRRAKSLGSYQDRLRPQQGHLYEEQRLILPLSYQAKPPTSQEKLESEVPSLPETKQPELETGNPVWVGILYGLINAAIVLPVLMSFGSIIYRDDAFTPYMPVLIKLTVFSGMVHQICFSSFSTLPFAVGQVQDAGLIFLSSMARSMAQYCHNQGHDDETLLATVTIGLGLATALLGFGLVLVGKFQLASYVQMLPTCVIGGYLAFIGWYVGLSGLELMAGGGDLTLKLLTNNIVFLLPGIMGGFFIYVLVRKLRHMAVLPTCIAILFVTFYAILFVTGSTVQEATDYGWIPKTDAPPVWYHLWDYLKFDKVVWWAYPSQIMTLLSMIFVVALSSSLDVAAIELELGQPLNYNHELQMVGVSNAISGLTGGYTGSYIFSQSIFSLRSGIRSRLAGYVLALCELVVLVLPVPILSYIPNFFFGSLLVMICIDLLHEWLWDVRAKVTRAEYGICIATFILIQVLGVEYGILVGVVVYMICRRLGLDVGKATLEREESEAGIEEQKLVSDEYGSTRTA